MRMSPAAVRDGLVAVAAAAGLFAVSAMERTATAPVALAAVCATLAAPLAVRNRWPVTVAIMSVPLALVGAALSSGAARLIPAAALAYAAFRRPERAGPLLLVSAAGILVSMVTSGPWSPGEPAARVAPPAALSPFAQAVLSGIAPVAVGYGMRLHRDRAEQRVHLLRAETERAATETRLRLARDVHDAVGHYLTAIRLQASAVRHGASTPPEAADRALKTIIDVSSAALEEVRALLLTLDGTGLSGLEALAARLTTPSRQVTVTWRGSLDGVPARIDQAAYRLAQEALTNAVRHADARRIGVTVSRDGAGLTVVVEDDGPTMPPPSFLPGRGLAGMRERAHLLGGELSVRPAQPHGWRVSATLPEAAP